MYIRSPPCHLHSRLLMCITFKQHLLFSDLIIEDEVCYPLSERRITLLVCFNCDSYGNELKPFETTAGLSEPPDSSVNCISTPLDRVKGSSYCKVRPE